MLQTKDLRPTLRPLDATLTENGGRGTLLSIRNRQSLTSAILSSPGGAFARSRQECPADSQRAVSHRESAGWQPGLSGFDPRIPRLRAQNPGPPRGHEQLRPVDSFVPDR